MTQVQFGHITARPATLEYASCILTKYCSDEEPIVISLPNWWGENSALAYVARQFKALSQVLAVDEERMSLFFAPEYRFKLEDIGVDVSPIQEDFITAYMELKGMPERPSEIAIIFAKGDELIESYHRLLNVKKFNYLENKKSLCEHGIKNRPRGAITHELAMQELKQLFTRWNPQSICTKEPDVKEVLPFLHERVKCLPLLPWQYRPAHFSHIVAKMFKSTFEKKKTNSICSPIYHSNYVGPTAIPCTLGQANKVHYGYQCALADAVERWKFRTSSVSTRME